MHVYNKQITITHQKVVFTENKRYVDKLQNIYG